MWVELSRWSGWPAWASGQARQARTSGPPVAPQRGGSGGWTGSGGWGGLAIQNGAKIDQNAIQDAIKKPKKKRRCTEFASRGEVFLLGRRKELGLNPSAQRLVGFQNVLDTCVNVSKFL